MLDQFLKIAKFLLISIKMYVFIEWHDGIMDRVLDIQAKCRISIKKIRKFQLIFINF